MKLPRRTIIGFVLLAGVVGTLWLALVVHQAGHETSRAHFEAAAAKLTHAIEYRLSVDISAVESTAALFAAAPHDVTRDDFRLVTRHLLERHPSLRAIGWNPRIHAAERAAYEARLRAQGFEGYRITERSDSGEMVPAADRAEYTAVQYIEPREGNEAAHGFDVGSEARRRAAMERASATGELSITGQISLVQKDGSPGLLAFRPVYERRSATPTSDDEPLLLGFAVGVFEVADVIEQAIRSSRELDMAVRVADVTEGAPGQLLFGTAGATPESIADSRVRHVATLEVGGRRWSLQFAPGRAGQAELTGLAWWATLCLGLTITGLITAYLVSALRANEALTSEIAERQLLELERRELDARLQDARKLESLGVMAGGIAHDFNNLLAVILGNADLALTELAPESPARDELEQVRLAATRAADLTRQMLAYSGARPLETERFDLARLVEEMTHLLEAAVSKHAVLRCEIEEAPLFLDGDPTQIRQIVMNLITNASEALGENPGTILVKTGGRTLDRAVLGRATLDETPGPGAYVFLEVSDTGCGIADDDLASVFDPFFTTKFQGRGLGLAGVLGIVRSHSGAIWVDSALDRGTTFTLAVPRAELPPDLRDGASVAASSPRAERGIVLVIDDEEAVRRLAARMLRRLGHEVHTAASGEEGVEMFRRHADRVRAVLLDATMPGMGGAATFRALRALDPDVAVILTSGHSERDSVRDLAGAVPDAFLPKPYRSADLAEVLTRVDPG